MYETHHSCVRVRVRVWFRLLGDPKYLGLCRESTKVEDTAVRALRGETLKKIDSDVVIVEEA